MSQHSQRDWPAFVNFRRYSPPPGPKSPRRRGKWRKSWRKQAVGGNRR